MQSLSEGSNQRSRFLQMSVSSKFPKRNTTMKGFETILTVYFVHQFSKG
jgi:hypothetical protein